MLTALLLVIGVQAPGPAAPAPPMADPARIAAWRAAAMQCGFSAEAADIMMGVSAQTDPPREVIPNPDLRMIRCLMKLVPSMPLTPGPHSRIGFISEPSPRAPARHGGRR